VIGLKAQEARFYNLLEIHVSFCTSMKVMELSKMSMFGLWILEICYGLGSLKYIFELYNLQYSFRLRKVKTYFRLYSLK